jgi:hypothetical protein
MIEDAQQFEIHKMTVGDRRELEIVHTEDWHREMVGIAGSWRHLSLHC